MSAEFIEKRVWARLRVACRKCRRPAVVAVAYFAKGAAKLLPLKKGSLLVVDASESSVKNGQTCPAELLQLQKKHVRIFSVHNLHAKVYVFGGQAFIGSANASQSSSAKLIEAVVRTTDSEAVKSARRFVKQLCLQELGPEALRRLQKLYRPPKFPVDIPRKQPANSNGRVRAQLSGLHLVHLQPKGYPKGSEEAAAQGRQVAESKRKHRRTHFLDEFSWSKDTFSKGDAVVQLVDEYEGSKLVVPPGEVIDTRKWSNGRQHCTFIYLEVPHRRRIRMNKLAKRLGRGASKKLKRSGRVNQDFAGKLRAVWQN